MGQRLSIGSRFSQNRTLAFRFYHLPRVLITLPERPSATTALPYRSQPIREIDSSPLFVDNKAMLNRLVHLLMIATVLACPVLCMRCSAGGVAETVSVSACDHGCCHSDSPAIPVQQPQDDCPGDCHDCFCAGAVPSGPTVSVLLAVNWFSSEFFVPTSASTLASMHRMSKRFAAVPLPRTANERLATLCTLLI